MGRTRWSSSGCTATGCSRIEVDAPLRLRKNADAHGRHHRGRVTPVLLLAVCDFPPGAKEGLSLQWIQEHDPYAYNLTLGTAEKVLFKVLHHNSADIRSKIAETGHDGANHVRQQCRELMDKALVLGQEEQRAELWRRTT